MLDANYHWHQKKLLWFLVIRYSSVTYDICPKAMIAPWLDGLIRASPLGIYDISIFMRISGVSCLFWRRLYVLFVANRMDSQNSINCSIWVIDSMHKFWSYVGGRSFKTPAWTRRCEPTIRCLWDSWGVICWKQGKLAKHLPRHKVSTNNLAGSCSRFKILND